jgi:hypothetical protein
MSWQWRSGIVEVLDDDADLKRGCPVRVPIIVAIAVETLG